MKVANQISNGANSVTITSEHVDEQSKNAEKQPLVVDDGFDSESSSEKPAKKFKSRENEVRYRHVFTDAKKLWGKQQIEKAKRPWPNWDAVASEEAFIKNPNVSDFFKLVKGFERTMRVVGHQKYLWLDHIMVDNSNMSLGKSIHAMPYSSDKFQKIEAWHEKKASKFDKSETKEVAKSDKRRQLIAVKGPGIGGKMTSKIGRSKAASFYAKNNLTIRGNVFKLTHKAVPRNLYEIMPRYGYRKSAHIGVRVSQFTITTFLAGLGYFLMPVTFGVSKIITDHTRTLITLSGEAITHKIAGAENHKVAVHSGLRGMQLEIPRCIPIAGDVVNIGESIALGTAAFGIVSTTLADALFSHISDRYTSTLNVDDLGDSSCLAELNHRIDYLSRFLLPHGQLLLLKEPDMEMRSKLKATLKEQFKMLRSLEKKKIESLNYYRLALAAEKIPKHLREKISGDCEQALPETHINTHKVVRQCLNQLIDQDRDLAQLRPEAKSSARQVAQKESSLV